MTLPWLATSDQRRFANAGALALLLIVLVAWSLSGSGARYASVVIVCSLATVIPATLMANKAARFLFLLLTVMASWMFVDATAGSLGLPGDRQPLREALDLMLAILAAPVVFMMGFVATRMLVVTAAPESKGRYAEKSIRPAAIAFAFLVIGGSLVVPLLI
jgi:hypothetical protein